MTALPEEIIDKIFAYTDPETCIKHKRFYALRDFPWVTIDWAAENGYLEVVKYFHKIGQK